VVLPVFFRQTDAGVIIKSAFDTPVTHSGPDDAGNGWLRISGAAEDGRNVGRNSGGYIEWPRADVGAKEFFKPESIPYCAQGIRGRGRVDWKSGRVDP
jgi:hypothetical protein